MPTFELGVECRTVPLLLVSQVSMLLLLLLLVSFPPCQNGGPRTGDPSVVGIIVDGVLIV